MVFLSRITTSLILLGLLIFLGGLGFYYIDRYPLVDALYMSVITITTVGFGEIYPLSPAGRLFTVVLILLGFIVLGLVGHSIVESLLERVWVGRAWEKKMKKRIERLQKHHVVCGYGRVGRVTAEHLHAAGVPFVVIEAGEEGCQELRDKGFLYVQSDATRESGLEEACIKEASGLLALLDSDPKNLFVVLTARELNPTLHIIARSEDKSTEKKILRAGADVIISPFESAGRQIADNLLGKSAVGPAHGGHVPLHPEWIRVLEGSSMVGSAVSEVADTMGCDILGLRREGVDLLQPGGETVLQPDDLLLVMSEAVENGEGPATAAAPKKIVIVDDNPVIVRLYARLFQRAGFHPRVALTGDEGLALIRSEEPDVAVIDYRLPGISGLEICRTLRQQNEPLASAIKLVVFTAEDDPALADQARQAGADGVVVKSSDAGAVIRIVNDLLNVKTMQS